MYWEISKEGWVLKRQDSDFEYALIKYDITSDNYYILHIEEESSGRTYLGTGCAQVAKLMVTNILTKLRRERIKELELEITGLSLACGIAVDE